jgi:MFS family permease
MTTARHLIYLLHGRWFRRLFAVRVASQFTDGVFQVALAAYVIFSPERQPSPGAIAAALAAVLLPFSVLGPFVGVFLDRWSRRQVLALSNFVRVARVLVLVAAVSADLDGPLLFTLILACLSVNRFLLAALSAALPHVVRREDLLVANAVTPTSGTLAALLGLGFGTVSRILWNQVGVEADAAVLCTAAVLYGAAGLLALRIPRNLLGPDYDPDLPAVREAARHVARGLGDGLRHLRERPVPAHGLAAIGAHRFFYGISTVMLILLYRNYFHAPAEADAAFRGLAEAVLVSGVGYVLAAFVTPLVTERLSMPRWIVILLAAPGALQHVVVDAADPLLERHRAHRQVDRQGPGPVAGDPVQPGRAHRDGNHRPQGAVLVLLLLRHQPEGPEEAVQRVGDDGDHQLVRPYAVLTGEAAHLRPRQRHTHHLAVR